MRNDTIKINTIYTTFDGEQNPYGIGYPTIFVRFQGCHIRCYVKTLGVLCDTPEALELDSPNAKDYTVEELVHHVQRMGSSSGIDKVTITGGDPLFRHKEEKLHKLFRALRHAGFSKITVETSGTVKWAPYLIHDHVSFILDWKGKSTGIPQRLNLLYHSEQRETLRSHDYVKFVVYDDDDFQELVQAVPLFDGSPAVLTAGVYFKGKISTFDLFSKLHHAGLLGRVRINAQVHQLEKFLTAEFRQKDLGIDI